MFLLAERLGHRSVPFLCDMDLISPFPFWIQYIPVKRIDFRCLATCQAACKATLISGQGIPSFLGRWTLRSVFGPFEVHRSIKGGRVEMRTPRITVFSPYFSPFKIWCGECYGIMALWNIMELDSSNFTTELWIKATLDPGAMSAMCYTLQHHGAMGWTERKTLKVSYSTHFNSFNTLQFAYKKGPSTNWAVKLEAISPDVVAVLLWLEPFDEWSYQKGPSTGVEENNKYLRWDDMSGDGFMLQW